MSDYTDIHKIITNAERAPDYEGEFFEITAAVQKLSARLEQLAQYVARPNQTEPQQPGDTSELPSFINTLERVASLKEVDWVLPGMLATILRSIQTELTKLENRIHALEINKGGR